MSPRGAIALWAGFLAALTLLMLLFGPDPIAPLLLGGAAAGTLALALVAPGDRVPGAPPASSLPALAAAAGIAALVGGSEFGPWLLAIGAGLLVLSLGMLVQERRSR